MVIVPIYTKVSNNGCGKSTFMKILTGELTPTSGTVGISDGERLGVLRPRELLGIAGKIAK
jgi:ATPase subunit of ABC transporter with duplicated ATPase domains